MAQIKDTNIVKTPEVVLNPVFFMPPDVVDIKVGYEDTTQENIANTTYSDIIDGQDATDFDVTSGQSTDTTESGETPMPPQFMNVVEQTVRIAPDGKSVVDVVVEFEDLLGNNEYDVRITKQ